MTDTKLVEFIKEARKRGFGDTTIRDALMNHGWPIKEVESAFVSLAPRYKSKNQVTLFLDEEVLELLEKRAKKNMFTVSEQIEDILRRSVLSLKNKKKTTTNEKIDDTLLKIFSRKNTGPKKKSKK